jgi:phosphocarrier protein
MVKTYNQEVILSNKRGLHARASAKFVQLAETFTTTTITVQKDHYNVSGLSIMGLMMLGASYGTSITITTSDNDEQNAHHALCSLIELLNNKFGEIE